MTELGSIWPQAITLAFPGTNCTVWRILYAHKLQQINIMQFIRVIYIEWWETDNFKSGASDEAKCPWSMNSTFPCLFVVILLHSTLWNRELQPVLEEVSVAVRKASVLSCLFSFQLPRVPAKCQSGLIGQLVSRDQNRAAHLTQVIRPSQDGKEPLKLWTNLLMMQISDLHLDASLMPLPPEPLRCQKFHCLLSHIFLSVIYVNNHLFS